MFCKDQRTCVETYQWTRFACLSRWTDIYTCIEGDSAPLKGPPKGLRRGGGAEGRRGGRALMVYTTTRPNRPKMFITLTNPQFPGRIASSRYTEPRLNKQHTCAVAAQSPHHVIVICEDRL